MIKITLDIEYRLFADKENERYFIHTYHDGNHNYLLDRIYYEKDLKEMKVSIHDIIESLNLYNEKIFQQWGDSYEKSKHPPITLDPYKEALAEKLHALCCNKSHDDADKGKFITKGCDFYINQQEARDEWRVLAERYKTVSDIENYRNCVIDLKSDNQNGLEIFLTIAGKIMDVSELIDLCDALILQTEPSELPEDEPVGESDLSSCTSAPYLDSDNLDSQLADPNDSSPPDQSIIDNLDIPLAGDQLPDVE